MLCGKSPEEIYKDITRVSDFIRGSTGLLANLKDYGLAKCCDILKFVGDLCDLTFGKRVTFKKLYERTGKDFIVVTTNINVGGAHYFSRFTEPDADVVDAIYMSCNIPGIFTRILHNSQWHVDGGLADNFALRYTQEKFPNIKILGVSVSQLTTVNEVDGLSYVYRIFTIPSTHEIKYHHTNAYVLHLRLDDLATLMDKNKAPDMFIQGYNDADKFVDKDFLP
jgi:predicted acylesterase/phospholipase RssA